MNTETINTTVAITPSQLTQVLRFAIKHKEPVLIKGAPGTGKSDIVAQACADTGADLIISHPVVSDPTDYKGLPFPTKHISADGTVTDAAHFLPFGELHQLIEAKKPTVYLLDDLGQAPMSVQSAIMQLILARRINGHKVSDHVIFIACTNNRQDRAGVMGILEPVKSRFSAIVELQTNVDDWVKWAIVNNMPHELISFIRFRPSLLHNFKPTADIENSPCPRTVAAVGRLMNAQLDESIRYAMWSGAVGSGFATELKTYLEVYQDLPSYQDILNDPEHVEIKDGNPSVTFALGGLIAHNVTVKAFDTLMKFIRRFTGDFQVMMVKDCYSHNKAITSTQSFVEWSVENQNILL